MTASPVPWRARALLAIAILALRAPSLTEPRWYSDDGFFTAVAYAMSRGVPLYAGVFDNSPPGIYWLYRLLLLLGGDHRLVQAYAALAVVAAALLTVEVARPAGHPAPLLAGALAGFALSVPTLDGDLLNVELAALPFFVGGLALSFAQRPAWHLAAGAMLGAGDG